MRVSAYVRLPPSVSSSGYALPFDSRRSFLTDKLILYGLDGL